MRKPSPRQSLRRNFSRLRKVRYICSIVSTVQSALEEVRINNPELVITGLEVSSGGVDLIQRMLAQSPKLSILVFSYLDEKVYAERVIRAGARGFVSKQ